MKAYPIFWLNGNNFIGIVTSEEPITAQRVLDVFLLHYHEFEFRRAELFVVDRIHHVHTL